MSGIIPIFIPHAGCLHECVFCNQRRISDRVCTPVPGQVRKQIEEGLAAGLNEKPQIAFYGGSFTALEEGLRRAFLEEAYAFVAAGQAECIRISTRPDAVGEAVLSELEHYGVKIIELGAQSMDEEVLRTARRGHTATDVEKSARLVLARGFRLVLQMMTGLPGDSREKALCTAERIAALCPEGVRIYPVVVVRDTPLYDLYRAGLYSPPDVREAAALCGELLEFFWEKNIPVIRTGLHPGEDLSAGGAVAGAYHPAFGELAHARFYFRRAEALLQCAQGAKTAVLRVHPSAVSQMTGHRRENITGLEARFGIRLRVAGDAELKKGDIRLNIEYSKRSAVN